MKKIAIVMAIAIALTGASMIGQYRYNRMMAYAETNNCEWQYGYYLDDEPICK